MKKLLLILLCLPMIGFGQDDKIIFSSGDTIYGKVIEVGVNDITYQHKGETTNNISKKRELAKVIYSSGREETFDGLRVLESKKENEKKQQIQKNYKKSFEIGLVLGPTLNTYSRATYPYEGVLGYNAGLTFKHNFSPLFSLKYNLQYQKKGAKLNDVYEQHLGYLSLPFVAQFLFGNNIKFYANSGLYLSYLIDGHTHIDWTDLTFGDMIDPQYGFIYPTSEDQAIDSPTKSDLNLSGYNRLDFGPVFGIGTSFKINQQIIITFELSSHLGLVPIYSNYSLNNSNGVFNRSYLGLIGVSYNLKTID